MHVRMRLRRHAVRLPACRPSFGAGGIDPKYIQLVGVWGPPLPPFLCVDYIQRGGKMLFLSFVGSHDYLYNVSKQNKTKQLLGSYLLPVGNHFLNGGASGGSLSPPQIY